MIRSLCAGLVLAFACTGCIAVAVMQDVHDLQKETRELAARVDSLAARLDSLSVSR